MKLQDQVTSLELSKQINTLLKEKGMEVRESLFYWIENSVVKSDTQIKLKTECGSWKHSKKIQNGGCIKYFPAYTCSELGEMLPGNCISHKSKIDDKWFCTKEYEKESPHHYVEEDTEVEARGRMLVYLLSNNLLKSDEK